MPILIQLVCFFALLLGGLSELEFTFTNSKLLMVIKLYIRKLLNGMALCHQALAFHRSPEILSRTRRKLRAPGPGDTK